MMTDIFVHALHVIDVSDAWFQQYGSTCQTSHTTIDLLRQTFNGRLMNQNGDINCPPISYDLSLFDYFLWGIVKEKCYADKPKTIEDLKANILDVIVDPIHSKKYTKIISFEWCTPRLATAYE